MKDKKIQLSEIQKKIVTTDRPHVLVLSSAASGKSAVLVERIRYLLDQGVDPSKIVAITFTNNAASVMLERLGNPDGLFISTVHAYANYLLRGGAFDTSDILNEERFDDLFEEIKNNPYCLKHVEHLLLDEGQDSTRAQFEFFELINPDNYMYFADIKQCQPKGTKILMADLSEKNIEEIKIGDQIIAYNNETGYIQGGLANNARKIYINNIEYHDTNEPLITIKTKKGLSSSYTPGHICIGNLRNYKEYNYLVYLMCDKDNRFRVGTSQFRNSTSAPWRTKMRDEGCEKIWILDIFKTNKESRVLEDKISYKYQIPQVTFQLDKTTYTQQDLDYIYDGLDTYTSAIKCLSDFHRDIRYPFSQKGNNIHYASNAYNEIFACNLLPKVMDVKIFDENEKKRSNFDTIEEITYSDNSIKTVYSLDVPELHTYIADKIVTHNCIYGFASACPEYLIDLSYQNDVTVYSMGQNWRNRPDILRFAKKFLYRLGPDYDDTSIAMRTKEMNRFNVIEGDYTPSEAVKSLILNNERLGTKWGDWFVLCRTNSDVNLFQQLFEKENIPTDTFRQADLTNAEIEEKLKENTVKVLTAHSSKGLEAPCVLSYNIRAYNDDEARLCYVAATRARDFLIWAKMPPKKRKRSTGVVNWE